MPSLSEDSSPTCANVAQLQDWLEKALSANHDKLLRTHVTQVQDWLEKTLAANHDRLLQTLTGQHRELLLQIGKNGSRHSCFDQEYLNVGSPTARASFQELHESNEYTSNDSMKAWTLSAERSNAENRGQRSGLKGMILIVAHSKYFELAMVFALLFNLVLAAIETQYDGFHYGCEIDFYRRCGVWSGDNFNLIMDMCAVLFCLIFICEAIIRISATAMDSPNLCTGDRLWILFDLVVIAVDVFALTPVVNGVNGVRPSVFRMVRLVRIVRLVRLFKKFDIFDSLFLLIRSIQASFNALIWSFALLLLLQMFMAVLLGSVLEGFINDETNSIEVRRDVYKYFGTFSRGLITMFEISLGNWVPSCRFLVDNVSEWFQLFYIIYTCMFCFAVVRVISAVFIAETNRMIQHDEDLEIRKKRRVAEKHNRQLRNLFPELAGGTQLTKDRLAEILKNDDIRARLVALDIDCNDLDALFDVLDDMDPDNGDGIVEQDDFIKGVAYLKGNSRSLDVLYLRKQMNQVIECLHDIPNKIQASSRQARGAPLPQSR